MIDWNVHKSLLGDQAKQLSEWHRVIFAATCSERALPLYKAYAAHAREGRLAISQFASLQSANEFIWQGIEVTNFDQAHAEGHLRALEALAEQGEVAPPPWARWQTHALDTIYIVMYAIHTLLSKDVKDMIAVTAALYDTVRYSVQSKASQEAPFKSQKSEFDRTVQVELQRQRRDMLLLFNRRHENPQLLARELHAQSQSEKVLPIITR